MIQTHQQFPSVSSQNKDLQVNSDGSVDVYFGPKRLQGKEANWIQTIPGKGWFMILRLYGPLEPWFDKTGVPARSSCLTRPFRNVAVITPATKMESGSRHADFRFRTEGGWTIFAQFRLAETA